MFADVSYVILSERRIQIFEFNSTTATSICSKQLWLRVVLYLIARDGIIKMRRGKSSRETINTRIALSSTRAPLGYRRGKRNEPTSQDICIFQRMHIDMEHHRSSSWTDYLLFPRSTKHELACAKKSTPTFEKTMKYARGEREVCSLTSERRTRNKKKKYLK